MSEQNEREAFEKWFDEQLENENAFTSDEPLCKQAWQHQQQRIDGLERDLAVLRIWQNVSKADKEILAKDAMDFLASRVESLQAQLNVAVEALEDIENWKFGWDGDCGVTSKATEALNTINKMKAGE